MSAELNNVLAGAMRLLATREHSQHELRRKLSQKGHDTSDIERAIEQLVAQKLQSDERFVESFIKSHRERGKGPKRIRLELQQHKLADGLVEMYLDENDDAWKELARTVKSKKFGDKKPDDFQQQVKQARFLEYRGFTHDQISAVLKDVL